MVDAVNAVISSVNTLPVANREAAGVAARSALVSNADSGSAPVQPKAPYVSPYIHVDFTFDKAVLQIRDSDTGDVVDQFPSQSRLQQLRRAEALSQQARELAASRQEPSVAQNVLDQSSNSQSIEFSGLGASTLIEAQTQSTSPASGPALPQVAVSALSSGVSSASVCRP